MSIKQSLNTIINEKMKKVLFLFAILLAMPLMANAQTDTQRLVVWLKSGQKVYHDLNDEPETSFNDGRLWLETNKVSVHYPLTDVLRYTFEGKLGPTMVEKVRPGEIKFSQGDDMMKFDGLAEGTRLELYSVDGKLLGVQQTHEGESSIVSLKGMPSGTYIVKVGEATYKIQKR